MKNQQQGFLRTLQLIFMALTMAQVLLAAVCFFFLKPEMEVASDDMLMQIMPLVLIALPVMGYFLFNMRRKEWEQEIDLASKMEKYRAGSLVKWAMFEGTTLTSLFLYIGLGGTVFFYIGLASLAHFLLHFPSRDRVGRELGTDLL